MTSSTNADDSMAMFAFIDRLPETIRARVVGLYLTSLARDAGLIESALAAGDLPSAGATAHKLWGGAANLQDVNLAQFAKAVETSAKDGQLEPARAAGAALGVRAQTSATVLRARYPGVEAG